MWSSDLGALRPPRVVLVIGFVSLILSLQAKNTTHGHKLGKSSSPGGRHPFHAYSVFNKELLSPKTQSLPKRSA